MHAYATSSPSYHPYIYIYNIIIIVYILSSPHIIHSYAHTRTHIYNIISFISSTMHIHIYNIDGNNDLTSRNTFPGLDLP